jgi:hypothetical protein
METSDRYTQISAKASPLSALIIFESGLGGPPTIVPSGGSERADDLIIEWFRRALAQGKAKAAA